MPKSASSGADEVWNIDIFDFTLTPDEVAAMSALDQGEAAADDSDRIGH